MDISDAIRVVEGEEVGKQPDEVVRDGRNVYLRIPLDPGYEAGYAYRMISGVQPACLLPVGIVREGHRVYADYRVSGWTALSSIPAEDLLGLLYGLVTALKNAADELAECLLSADDLSLEPGRIFLRRETGEIRFCYLLENARPFGESLQVLMDYFIRTAKPAGEQEVLLLYGLYQKSREENVTPEVLASFRTELLDGSRTSLQETFSSSGDDPENTVRSRYSREGSAFGGSSGTVPSFTTEVPEEEDQEIYEKLGMDPEDRNSGFSRWKKEREAKRQKEYEERRRARKEQEPLPIREVCDTKMYEDDEEAEKAPAPRKKGMPGVQEDLEGEAQEKKQSFFKKHLPEILIGAAAVILAVLALVL